MGARIGLLATARGARAQSSGSSSISSNFNGTPIPGGERIWFNAVMKMQGLGLRSGDRVCGSIQFTVDGMTYVVPVPSVVITFSPSVTVATTTFSGGLWVTTLPLSHLAGNVMLDACAVQVQKPDGFPASA